MNDVVALCQFMSFEKLLSKTGKARGDFLSLKQPTGLNKSITVSSENLK